MVNGDGRGTFQIRGEVFHISEDRPTFSRVAAKELCADGSVPNGWCSRNGLDPKNISVEIRKPAHESTRCHHL